MTYRRLVEELPRWMGEVFSCDAAGPGGNAKGIPFDGRTARKIVESFIRHGVWTCGILGMDARRMTRLQQDTIVRDVEDNILHATEIWELLPDRTSGEAVSVRDMVKAIHHRVFCILADDEVPYFAAIDPDTKRTMQTRLPVAPA